VPALDGALELLEGADAVSGGSARNREYAESFTTFARGVPEARRRLVCDATTSGGLLVAVASQRAGDLPGPVVGEIVAGVPGAIAVG
jgi:selenide,water dikinase